MTTPTNLPSGKRHPKLDYETAATNSGRITVSWLQYFRCYPTLPLICAGGFVLAIVIFNIPGFLGIRDKNPFVITATLIGVAAVLGCSPKMSFLKSAMADGDTCPAMIVDADREWIAVWADMRSTPGSCVPAIKIMQIPLKRSGHQAGGDARLTTVSTYYGDGVAGNWSDVLPVPVICATTDKKQIARSLTSVPANEWEALKAGIQAVPKPLRPGLYFLNE